MADLSWDSAQNFGKALTNYGSPGYGSSYTDTQAWVDALMNSDADTVKTQLQAAPSNLTEAEAGKAQPVLNTIRQFTYADANGDDQIFWEYVATLFALQITLAVEAQKEALKTIIEFARQNPEMSADEVVNHKETTEAIQPMAAGY